MKLFIYDFFPMPIRALASHGNFSGEQFREERLLPALRRAIESGETLDVRFDDLGGSSGAFMKEAFGGLYSRDRIDLPLAELKKAMTISADKAFYGPFMEEAWEYVEEAYAARQKARQDSGQAVSAAA